MFKRFAILSVVTAMFLCGGLAADEPSGSHLLDEIHNALDSGEIEPLQAVRRYRLAARRYRRDGALAGEALFSAGVVYEKMGRLSDAAGAYHSIISDYPGSIWFMPAVDALIESGEKILDEAEKGLFSGGFHRVRRIFSTLADVELPPEQKAFVRYKMGVSAMKAGRPAEAEFDFNNVLDAYPVEPWKEKSYFSLGEVYAGRARRPPRDQSHTRKAIAHFESFISMYPGSGLRGDAEKYLRDLGERKAEYLYQICDFYYRRGEKDAFDVYHGLLAAKYPETSWAALASEQFEF